MSNGWWERKLGQPRREIPPATQPVDRSLPRLPEQTPKNVPNITVTNDNFAEVSTQWSGGEATRREQMPCPNCGSELFFSRTNAGTVMSAGGMSSPAPRCYACGYSPGREMQGVPPA
jgi:hypothetical protein